jgi:alkaline phosphatase D
MRPRQQPEGPDDDDNDDVHNHSVAVLNGSILQLYQRCRSRHGSMIAAVVVVGFLVSVAVLMTLSQRSAPMTSDGHGGTTAMSTDKISALLNNLTLPDWRPLPDPSNTITRIAFGSCASQNIPQPYWDVLAAYEPDLVLLTGDNVYGDCLEDASCFRLREAYRDWSELPSLRGGAAALSVLATLDDHDYGLADCNMNNPHKDLARAYFQEFFQVDETRMPADGVYRSFEFGPPDRRVQVILLDTRYGRSPFAETGVETDPYRPDHDDLTKRMLSEKQWGWLEAQLAIPATVRVVVSSVQVLNGVTGFGAWRHLPAELDRLRTLLRRQKHGRVVLVSGDRHFGGLYRDAGSDDEGGELVEVTASSLTHTVPLGAFTNCTTAAECDEDDPMRIGDAVRVNHFGTLEIDWEAESVAVGLRRADQSYGSTYLKSYPEQGKFSDAGEILLAATFNFTELP